MKKVIIMRGLPGSGKSRYVRGLVEREGQVTVCSADHFFEKTRSHIAETGVYDEPYYDFDPRLLPQAHAACMTAFMEALSVGDECVVVDNTNIERWQYQAYELAARAVGYEVQIVEVMPQTLDELRLCAQRNSHSVPADVIGKMAIVFEHDDRATTISVN